MINVATLEERLNQAFKDGAEGFLDDQVHDLKANEAAEINNGGISAQLEYIIDMVGIEEAEEIVQAIIDENAE
jgi:hypothetical protein